MSTPKKNYFVICPTPQGEDEGDELYILAATDERDVDEAYQQDLYEEVVSGDFKEVRDAVREQGIKVQFI